MAAITRLIGAAVRVQRLLNEVESRAVALDTDDDANHFNSVVMNTSQLSDVINKLNRLDGKLAWFLWRSLVNLVRRMENQSPFECEASRSQNVEGRVEEAGRIWQVADRGHRRRIIDRLPLVSLFVGWSSSKHVDFLPDVDSEAWYPSPIGRQDLASAIRSCVVDPDLLLTLNYAVVCELRERKGRVRTVCYREADVFSIESFQQILSADLKQRCCTPENVDPVFVEDISETIREFVLNVDVNIENQCDVACRHDDDDDVVVRNNTVVDRDDAAAETSDACRGAEPVRITAAATQPWTPEKCQRRDKLDTETKPVVDESVRPNNITSPQMTTSNEDANVISVTRKPNISRFVRNAFVTCFPESKLLLEIAAVDGMQNRELVSERIVHNEFSSVAGTPDDTTQQADSPGSSLDVPHRSADESDVCQTCHCGTANDVIRLTTVHETNPANSRCIEVYKQDDINRTATTSRNQNCYPASKNVDGNMSNSKRSTPKNNQSLEDKLNDIRAAILSEDVIKQTARGSCGNAVTSASCRARDLRLHGQPAAGILQPTKVALATPAEQRMKTTSMCCGTNGFPPRTRSIKPGSGNAQTVMQPHAAGTEARDCANHVIASGARPLRPATARQTTYGQAITGSDRSPIVVDMSRDWPRSNLRVPTVCRRLSGGRCGCVSVTEDGRLPMEHFDGFSAVRIASPSDNYKLCSSRLPQTVQRVTNNVAERNQVNFESWKGVTNVGPIRSKRRRRFSNRPTTIPI